MVGNYNLGFISNEDIYNHVKETVLKYLTFIDLKKFNDSLIDPIKLTFDAKVYGKTFEEIIDSESIRQIDKANTNHIGYFHQNLFKYAGNGWEVPPKVFDVVNRPRKIYVEMKNKHNTMNSTSGMGTMMKFLKQLTEDPESTCMLVEAIAKRSQNIVWKASLNGVKYENENIRRVSIDKFYEIVFDDKTAFMRLCKALPSILDDVIADTHKGVIQNTVYSELQKLSTNTLKSLYLLAFETYEGFDRF